MTDAILVLLDIDHLTGSAPTPTGVEPSGAGPSSAPLGAPCGSSDTGRYCTLPHGHGGLHEAHGPLPADTLLHAWSA